MDQKTCDESAKNASDLKCSKILDGVEKSIACPTPQKTSEPLPTKSNEKKTQLPEKYKTIADLFSHMSCSLRLLHLRKKSPTFENICTQVEVLSKRKFFYAHLARMKYILPEGILIDKVLVHDKKSLCMKPDMKITLVFEVVEDNSEDSADMALRRYFSSRLIDFFNMHPEATDIPEAVLPEPFSQRTCSLICADLPVGKATDIPEAVLPEPFSQRTCSLICADLPVDKATDIPEAVLPEPFSQRTCSLICADLPVNSSTALSSTSNEIEMLLKNFHLSPSFGKHFSQKKVATQTEMLQCFPSSKTPLSSHASDCLDGQESESRLRKGCVLLSHCVTNPNPERGQQKESFSMCSQHSVINTPVHMIHPPHSVSCSTESSDIKIVSCADSLMTEIPAQSAPGSLMPISDVQNLTSKKSASCCKPAKRVLDFSLMEGNVGLDVGADKLESSRAPHEVDGIPESSRGCSEDWNSADSVALPQEVEESLCYSFEKSNPIQAGLDTWHHRSSSLLDLVNVIHSIFYSLKRIPITKEELLQKIITDSLDFVQIREVEEHLEFLEKLVPEWICKKLSPTGDIMYCINKMLDLGSVRSSLLRNMTVSAE